jgi:hypothetical protein
VKVKHATSLHVRSSHHTEFTDTRFHFHTPLERLNLFVKRLNLFNRANRSYALFAPSSPVSSAVAATSPATVSMAPTSHNRHGQVRVVPARAEFTHMIGIHRHTPLERLNLFVRYGEARRVRT